jgi:hypothetical protein
MTDNTANPIFLRHNLLGSCRILQSVRYELITEELIHLFQCLALCFGKEEDVADHGNEIEGEKEVEKLEANLRESNWGALSED